MKVDLSHQLELAEYLAESFFPQDMVNPVAIADVNGITNSFGEYGDAFDGLLELKDYRFHIYLNKNRLLSIDSPRSRFTLAHELGHYFIDSHREGLVAGCKPHPSFTEFATNSIVENQADEFAAMLIMPRKRFISNAKRIDIGINAIKKLSSTFGSSLMSTAIRYAKSDVGSVSVIFWAESERRWCWSSSDIQAITKNRAFRKTEDVARGSVTELILKNQMVDGETDRGSVLSEWFPSILRGSKEDRVCREEAVRLGSYGVLTFLEVF